MKIRHMIWALSCVSVLCMGTMSWAADTAITPEEGKARIAAGGEMTLIDVRTPEEFAGGHYPGAINIPVGELEARAGEVPSDKPVVLYCARGVRSARAYGIMQEKRPDIKQIVYIKGVPIY